MRSLAVFLVLLAPSLALAQGEPDLGQSAPHLVGASLTGAVLEPARPPSVPGLAMFDLAPTSRRARALFVLSPHARARVDSFGETGSFELEARWPMGLLEEWAPDGDWNGAFLGNLWLGLGLAHRTPEETVALHVGGAAPIGSYTPLRTYSRSPAVAWGSWDRWLLSADVLPIALSGEYEHRAYSWSIGVEGGGAIGVPFEDSPFAHLELYAQLALTVRWWLGGPVWMGVRSQAVVWAYEDTFWERGWLADAQVSVAPTLRVNVDDSALELRWLVHLDEPEGPSVIGSETSGTSMAFQLLWSTGVR